MYCMSVSRGRSTAYSTLFDGFSIAGKIVLLNLLKEFIAKV